MGRKYLIVNADDFGVSSGVNRGILECHTRGVVTSASLMVNRPGAQEAVAMSRDHPQLAVGLHWDCGGEGVPEIDLDDVAAVREEFERQLEKFQRLMGCQPTHLDSESHSHRKEHLMPLFREWVAPIGVPLRHSGEVRFVGSFYAQWYYLVTNLKYVSVPFLEKLLREEVPDGWTEFSCHPGYPSPEHESDYLMEREAEVRTLTHPQVRAAIEQLGINLVSYRDYHTGGAGVVA